MSFVLSSSLPPSEELPLLGTHSLVKGDLTQRSETCPPDALQKLWEGESEGRLKYNFLYAKKIKAFSRNMSKVGVLNENTI